MITEVIAACYSPTPSLKSGLTVEKPKKSFCHEYATILKFVLNFIVDNNRGYRSSFLLLSSTMPGLTVEEQKKSFCHDFNLEIRRQFSNLYYLKVSHLCP